MLAWSKQSIMHKSWGTNEDFELIRCLYTTLLEQIPLVQKAPLISWIYSRTAKTIFNWSCELLLRIEFVKKKKTCTAKCKDNTSFYCASCTHKQTHNTKSSPIHVKMILMNRFSIWITQKDPQTQFESLWRTLH